MLLLLYSVRLIQPQAPGHYQLTRLVPDESRTPDKDRHSAESHPGSHALPASGSGAGGGGGGGAGGSGGGSGGGDSSNSRSLQHIYSHPIRNKDMLGFYSEPFAMSRPRFGPAASSAEDAAARAFPPPPSEFHHHYMATAALGRSSSKRSLDAELEGGGHRKMRRVQSSPFDGYAYEHQCRGHGKKARGVVVVVVVVVVSLLPLSLPSLSLALFLLLLLSYLATRRPDSELWA